MKGAQYVAVLFAALLASTGADADSSRKLLQTVIAGTPATITISPSKPTVNAIVITPAIPYPQNAYFCNVTGDGGIPQQGPLPLTVRVPVGTTATIVFANITGPIPGASCQMAPGSGSPSVVQQQGGSPSVVQQQGSGSSSVVQQQGSSSVVQQKAGSTSSVVQQPSPPTSVQQLINNPSMVMQQAPGGTGTVVQQQYATSLNQQDSSINQYMSCVGNSSSVVQQQGGSPSVVQQQGGSPSVVQQQGPPSSVVQQQSTPATVVQQQKPPSTPATVVQQQSPPSSVVQQQSTPSSVVQQQSPPSSVVQQQSPPSSVVQQSSGRHLLEHGRHLLQAGTIEYISNNGSTGQPQLSVLDTTEGVPNISFKPTAAGQTAQFRGALQVAVTTTHNGFGTPYIPYQVDSKLSPQCNVQVNFVSF